MGPSPTTALTDFHKCSFPGCPLPVSIALSLVERFQDIIAAPGDHQGILYGEVNPAETIVLAGQEVGAFDSKEICIAMSRASHPVVGCYRIREGNSLALTTAEIELVSALFANAGCVVLLIERRPGRAAANFFFLSDGSFLNIPLLEFPVDAARLRRRTHQLKNLEEVPPPASPAPPDRMPQASQQDGLWQDAQAGFGLGALGLPKQTTPPGQKNAALPAAKPEAVASAAPQGIREEGKPVPRRGNRFSILAILVCLGLLALSAVLYVNRLPKPAASEVTVTRTQTSAATALRAERQGEDLKIIWDLNSAGVAGATAGVLDIDDGGTKKQIPMTADQVRFGNVLYTPVSAQVSVQLTTLRDNQNLGQGAVLVLLNRPPVPAAAPGQPKTRVPFEVQAARQIPVAPKTELPPQAEKTAPFERTPLRSFVPPPANSRIAEIPAAEGATPPALNRSPAPQLALTGLAAAPVQLAPPGAPRSAPSRAAEEPGLSNATPAAAVSTGPAKTNANDYVSPVLTFQAGVRMPPELPRVLKPMAINVLVDLDPGGRVTRVEPVAASGIHRLLLQAAVDAAWKCRFQPARNGQHPVSSRVTLVFHVAPGTE
jgi:hypothetical protein